MCTWMGWFSGPQSAKWAYGHGMWDGSQRMIPPERLILPVAMAFGLYGAADSVYGTCFGQPQDHWRRNPRYFLGDAGREPPTQALQFVISSERNRHMEWHHINVLRLRSIEGVFTTLRLPAYASLPASCSHPPWRRLYWFRATVLLQVL
jgi:hypothetical protein